MKHEYYLGKDIDEEKYIKAIEENNKNFTPSVRVANKYNRLLLFEGYNYHGVESYSLFMMIRRNSFFDFFDLNNTIPVEIPEKFACVDSVPTVVESKNFGKDAWRIGGIPTIRTKTVLNS